MDYTVSELQAWSEKIETAARTAGLDFYPQEFELINYQEMLAYEAYIGMPSRYPHWSFGKAYEKLKTLYQYNLTGLPYELVINSNPCVAYLMRDNTLLLQILTMAHVYAHNDFFKNNRLFRIGTDASSVLEMFKRHGDLIKSFVNDPSIGYEKVERTLDAAHALKMQTFRTIGQPRTNKEEVKLRLIERYYDEHKNRSILEPNEETAPPDFDKIPLEPQDDILSFIGEYGKLEEWQKSILDIVREETAYFIPQIETKIMNEGWASYWHYQMLQKLDLPASLFMEFMKRHNDIVAPAKNHLNPYYIGFEIYNDLAQRYGEKKLFEARALERDQSFIRRYLSQDMCKKLNLFTYMKEDDEYFVEEIADDEGWKIIRDRLSDMVGIGQVPYIRVMEISKKDNRLLLEHSYDGRELDKAYAEQTIKYVVRLWGNTVELKTIFKDKKSIILCSEEEKILYG